MQNTLVKGLIVFFLFFGVGGWVGGGDLDLQVKFNFKSLFTDFQLVRTITH